MTPMAWLVECDAGPVPLWAFYRTKQQAEEMAVALKEAYGTVTVTPLIEAPPESQMSMAEYEEFHTTHKTG